MADCFYHGYSFSGACYQCDRNTAAGLEEDGSPIKREPIAIEPAAPVASAPAQPIPPSGSIGDDAEFSQLLRDYYASNVTTRSGNRDRLITYIDRLADSTPAQPMSLGAERVAFEAWANSINDQRKCHRLKGTDQYTIPDVQAAWKAWQARSALATQQGDAK